MQKLTSIFLNLLACFTQDEEDAEEEELEEEEEKEKEHEEESLLFHSFKENLHCLFTPSISRLQNAKGVILLDILPQGECINAARYCSTLDRLKEAIRRKRPGLLRRGVVLQHDNATPHSANLTQQWLQRYGLEILSHPAHSPDLAPSDFHYFVWTLEAPFRRHGFRDRR
ncbi:histone-lysine N-methyltransferase SETMAR [Plakobranchus ocellatus]|uniref:Histone-lysine N-methyltransferase SETMAR n=1 Tax=Plakobranchus ocellatus TaxID=259542 RepID=A0AAV4DPK3_9GAST|nr:histone-lysine N-methyltransferase SETMAR [Plakobranchus ocellatus]